VNDLLVGIMIVFFFAATAGFLALCQRLMEESA
jgi:hypothetical protein